MNRSRLIASALALLATSAILAFPVPANSAICDKGSCNARITATVALGGIQCEDSPKIKIEVAISCPGQCTATQTFYRCATSNQSYQFTACGVTHTVSLSSGSWEDALVECSNIVYSAQ